MNRTQQDAYFRKCLEALVASEIPKAQEYCKVLENELSSNSVDGHLNMIVKLASGACLVKLGKDPNRSVRLLSEAVSTARNESDPSYLIETQRYLGICLRNLGDFEAAANAFNAAIDAAKHAGKLDARLLISFGNVLGEAEQLYEAERIYEQALTLTKHPKDKLLKANILSNLASLYERRSRLVLGPDVLRDKAKSITFGRAALECIGSSGNEETQSRFRANLALYEAMQSNSAENIEPIFEHIKLLQGINNLTSQALAWANLSMIYSQAGNADKAITCAEKSIKISDEVGSNPRKAEAYFELSKAFELKGELHLALDALKRYIQLNDSENRKRAAQTGIALALQAALEDAQRELTIVQNEHASNDNFRLVTLELMDSLPQGIALLNANGEVLYKNKIGAQLLTTLSLNEVIQSLMTAPKRKAIKFRNFNNIHIAMHAAQGASKVNNNNSEITLWLLLTSKEQRSQNSNLTLQHYGFTTIETAVANALLKGESTANICIKLDIKIRALRSHLSKIYKKLGVSNQREAVAMMTK